MTLGLLLLVILILLLLASIPTWPYSRAWGYYPSGILGLIILILLLFALLGYIPLMESRLSAPSMAPSVVEPSNTTVTPVEPTTPVHPGTGVEPRTE